MLKGLVVAALAIVLNIGCVAMIHEIDGTFNRMDNTLNEFMGEDIKLAVKTLGLPTAKDTELGIYEWSVIEHKRWCKVTLMVDGEGDVMEYNFDGNIGGCQRLYNW
ncbi:MAG: hypothetical protein ACRCW3_00205 [Metamycoplasmataceae bacterium]